MMDSRTSVPAEFVKGDRLAEAVVLFSEEPAAGNDGSGYPLSGALEVERGADEGCRGSGDGPAQAGVPEAIGQGMAMFDWICLRKGRSGHVRVV